MKLFLYALSFMGFAWNGYGEGLFSNLKDAILTAEHFFKDILGNFITVARKVKDVHDVLNAAVEENCQHKCPGGELKMGVNVVVFVFKYCVISCKKLYEMWI